MVAGHDRDVVALVDAVVSERVRERVRPLPPISPPSGEWSGRSGSLHVRWAGGENAIPENDGRRGKVLRLALELAPGDRHDFVLVLALDGKEAEPRDPDIAWAATEAAWRERVPEFLETAGTRDARGMRMP